MNIIEHGSLDPKSSVLVKVFKDDCRVAADGPSNKKKRGMEYDTMSRLLSELDNNSRYNGLEVWKLSDVVFLDDSPAILGRVVTVDHPQAIVDISHSTNESGTLASSSNAKSTLKVFKVSELELCPVDYSESTPSQQQKTPNLSTSPPETKSQLNQGISQHVAGTVQHHPVCILAPELAQESISSSSSIPSTLLLQQGHSPNSGSLIYGYTPLAIHTTDEGPTMLVERVSDGLAFLIHSGHSSTTGGLVSTSFVALNSKDSKPNRFTIEEESVPALEGGFKVDPALLNQFQTADSFDSVSVSSENAERSNTLSSKGSKRTSASSMEVESTPSPVKAKPVLPQRRSSRKRKLDKSAVSQQQADQQANKPQTPSTIPEKPTTASSSNTTTGSTSSTRHRNSRHMLYRMPRICSQPLFIRDVNGMVCPLFDGLNLKPVPGGRATETALPTVPYRCIALRQYAVSKDQNVLVVVLGKPIHDMYSVYECTCFVPLVHVN